MNSVYNYEYPNIFSYDEQLILNQVGMYTSLIDCINIVIVQRATTQDTEARSVLDNLYYKLKGLSNEEWKNIQNHMPFITPYGFYDEDEEQHEHEEWTEEDVQSFISIIEKMEKDNNEVVQ